MVLCPEVIFWYVINTNEIIERFASQKARIFYIQKSIYLNIIFSLNNFYLWVRYQYFK